LKKINIFLIFISVFIICTSETILIAISDQKVSTPKALKIRRSTARYPKSGSIYSHPKRSARGNFITKYVQGDSRISYVRSILQPNAWLCGAFVLFNAFMVEKFLEQNTDIESFFSPQNGFYTYDKFKEFYTSQNGDSLFDVVYKKRLSAGKYLEIDEFGFNCPSRGNKNNVNYLEDSEIEEIARKLNLKEHYFLAIIDKKVIVNHVETTLEKIKFNLKKQNSLAVIHFFCLVNSNHWVLISIINSLKGPKMIVMDSLSEVMRPSVGVLRFITALKKIFI